MANNVFDSLIGNLSSDYSIIIEGFGGIGSSYEILFGGVVVIRCYSFDQFLCEVAKIAAQSIPRHALSDN